ncbi:MAG: sensor domain-containing diguanylate cyclase [Treponema sp.]|nr:sensor domain-containing diguanylate cyclase [Treponema sp.]
MEHCGELFSNRVIALLDVINDNGLGLWEMTDIVSLDDKAGKLMGLKEARKISLDEFMGLIHEEDRREVEAALAKLKKTPGASGTVECRVFNKKNKAYRWIRLLGKSYLSQGESLILGSSQLIEGKALEHLNARIDDITRELSRKDKLYQCMFAATEILLNADDTVFETCFQDCLGIIGQTVGLARVYVYKSHMVGGNPCCTEVHEWVNGIEPTMGEDFTKDMPLDAWPGLEQVLNSGKNYNSLVKKTPGEIQAMIPRGIGAVLYAPIFLKDFLWGFVGYERVEEKLFHGDEEAVLASISLLLANSLIRYDLNKNLYLAVDKINTTAIKAEVLEKFAYTDALTGLYNRRHFMELAQSALEKSRRFNTPCYLMILDLDFFKKINDTYGHLAGDEVLKNAALVMKNAIRAYDLLARYGGEEFVVLVSEAGKEEAVLNLAERIRESIAATPCVYNCIKITCTVSIGVAETFPDCTVESLIGRADKGLYQAKESGRNQVILYEEDPAI